MELIAGLEMKVTARKKDEGRRKRKGREERGTKEEQEVGLGGLLFAIIAS